MNNKQNLNNQEVLTIPKRTPYVISHDELLKIMTQSKESQTLENVNAEDSKLSINNRGEVGPNTDYKHINEKAPSIPNLVPNLTTDDMEVLAIPKRTPYIITSQEMLEIKNRPRPVLSPQDQARLDEFRRQLIVNTKEYQPKKRILTPKK